MRRSIRQAVANGNCYSRFCLSLGTDGVHLGTLARFPQGVAFLGCIQCGACAATCPGGEVRNHPPGRVIPMMRAGMVETGITEEVLRNCDARDAGIASRPRRIHLTALTRLAPLSAYALRTP